MHQNAVSNGYSDRARYAPAFRTAAGKARNAV
ncbi:hypothetical protein N875_08890 [Neisseria meningitidis LNP21362]|nr:hypothetical protein N875_08890 [Neisseria meningitidis LNP21362]